MAREFSNWAGINSCQPAKLCEPKSIPELQAVLEDARRTSRRLRVVGSLCSPNDIAMSDDIMVSLRHMNRVLGVDAARRMVKIEAGITLAELNDVLDLHGLALPNLGSVSWPTFGGMISTGAHATGAEYGFLASCVVELQVMLASGELVICSRKVYEDLFQAALCSMGCLCVITGAVIRVVPAFDLHVAETQTTLSAILRSLPARVASAPMYKFTWWPHTQHALEWRAVPVPPRLAREAAAESSGLDPAVLATGLPPPPAYGWAAEALVSWAEWVRDSLIGHRLLEFVLWVALAVPFIIPWVNAAWFRVVFSARRPRVDRSDSVLNFDCLFRQHVAEWSVALADLPQALSEIDAVIAARGFRAHFPVEVRFVAADDAWLSPASDPDAAAAAAAEAAAAAADAALTSPSVPRTPPPRPRPGVFAFVGVIMYRPYGGDAAFEEYFSEVERIFLRLGGRPHWAKAYSIAGDADFGALYPMWAEFKRLRELVDPQGLFVNAWARRVLGLGGGAEATPGGRGGGGRAAAHPPPLQLPLSARQRAAKGDLSAYGELRGGTHAQSGYAFPPADVVEARFAGVDSDHDDGGGAAAAAAAAADAGLPLLRNRTTAGPAPAQPGPAKRSPASGGAGGRGGARRHGPASL